MNSALFLKEYKNLIKSLYSKENDEIIAKIALSERASFSKRDNKCFLIRTFKEIKNYLVNKENENEDIQESYILVGSPDIKSLNPDLFSLGGAYIFTINFEAETIFNEDENTEFTPDQLNWYLIKATPFFKLRNTSYLIEKFDNRDFSNIDKIILGEKEVSFNPSHDFVEKAEDLLETLDDSQQEAFINAINAKDIAIIKGPPGTGKTHTISKIIEYYFRNDKKVIFASSVHSALDSLVDKLNRNQFLIKNAKVTRSSGRLDSLAWQGKVSKSNNDIYITTFASLNLHPELESLDIKDTILIVDEGSATPVFDILSKTAFSNKLILVGDDMQLQPIWDKKEKIGDINSLYKDEFSLFMISSIFESLVSKNPLSLTMLKNNYRSEKKIVDLVNFFYENKLNYCHNSTGTNIEYINFNNDYELVNKIREITKQVNVNNSIFITNFKNDVKAFNKALGASLFRTCKSVQGLESDNVIFVLKGNEVKANFQLDFRTLNVSLSRAKRKLYILVCDDIDQKRIINASGYKILPFLHQGNNYSFENMYIIQNQFNSTKATDLRKINNLLDQSNNVTSKAGIQVQEYYDNLEIRIKENKVYKGFEIKNIKTRVINKNLPIFNYVECNEEAVFISDKNEIAINEKAIEILTKYLVEGLTIAKIAEELKIDPIPVSSTLAYYGIKAGSKSRGKLQDTSNSNELIKQLIVV